MKKKFKVKGIDKVVKRINTEMSKMEGKVSSKGFIRVAMAIQQETESGTVKTPVDTGNLRSSFFSVIKGGHEAQNIGGLSSKGISEDDKRYQQRVIATAKTTVDSKSNPNMIFGFAANYTYWVHENMNGDIKWKRPGSGPKFFEAALKSKEHEIIKILGDSAR